MTNLLDTVNPRHNACAAEVRTYRAARGDYREETLQRSHCTEHRYSYNPVRPNVPFAHRAAYMIKFPIADRGLKNEGDTRPPPPPAPARELPSPQARGLFHPIE